MKSELYKLPDNPKYINDSVILSIYCTWQYFNQNVTPTEQDVPQKVRTGTSGEPIHRMDTHGQGDDVYVKI